MAATDQCLGAQPDLFRVNRRVSNDKSNFHPSHHTATGRKFQNESYFELGVAIMSIVIVRPARPVPVTGAFDAAGGLCGL